MTNKTLHDSWLSYLNIVASRVPDELRPWFEKQLQGAFYAGAFSVVCDEVLTKEQLWRMCESGMADACGRPEMRLTNDDGFTFSERERQRNETTNAKLTGAARHERE
jgi:hypothetical protein